MSADLGRKQHVTPSEGGGGTEESRCITVFPLDVSEGKEDAGKIVHTAWGSSVTPSEGGCSLHRAGRKSACEEGKQGLAAPLFCSPVCLFSSLPRDVFVKKSLLDFDIGSSKKCSLSSLVGAGEQKPIKLKKKRQGSRTGVQPASTLHCIAMHRPGKCGKRTTLLLCCCTVGSGM